MSQWTSSFSLIGPTGPAGSFTPQGTIYGDYVYYDGATWAVGSTIVSIGSGAGQISQDCNSVAVGYQAGYQNQSTHSVAIGPSAGFQNQNSEAVAIGSNSGSLTQGKGAVAIGSVAGYNAQSDFSIAIGFQAGAAQQSTSAVAIGYYAGNNSQEPNAIAIGLTCAQNTQRTNAIAMGTQAAYNNQGVQAIAIGNTAGNSGQGNSAIAIGASAGNGYQSTNSIAIGTSAGQTNQDSNSIAIGYNAGLLNQRPNAISLGTSAGREYQGDNAVAIGESAGYGVQSTNAIAVGLLAGFSNQGSNAIALGAYAGCNAQSYNTIAIGFQSATVSQRNHAIAIGTYAGQNNQASGGIAIGWYAGNSDQLQTGLAVGQESAFIGQAQYATAVGFQAGYSNQGTQSLALGYLAGVSNQHANTIVLNAQTVALDTTHSDSLFVAPIREPDASNQSAMFYDRTTKEVIYNSSITFSTNQVVLIGGNVAPDQNTTYSLGLSTQRYKDVFVGPGFINIEGPTNTITNISADANSFLNIDTGLTTSLLYISSAHLSTVYMPDLELVSTNNILFYNSTSGLVSYGPYPNLTQYATISTPQTLYSKTLSTTILQQSTIVYGTFTVNGSGGTNGQVLAATGSGLTWASPANLPFVSFSKDSSQDISTSVVVFPATATLSSGTVFGNMSSGVFNFTATGNYQVIVSFNLSQFNSGTGYPDADLWGVVNGTGGGASPGADRVVQMQTNSVKKGSVSEIINISSVNTRFYWWCQNAARVNGTGDTKTKLAFVQLASLSAA